MTITICDSLLSKLKMDETSNISRVITIPLARKLKDYEMLQDESGRVRVKLQFSTKRDICSATVTLDRGTIFVSYNSRIQIPKEKSPSFPIGCSNIEAVVKAIKWIQELVQDEIVERALSTLQV